MRAEGLELSSRLSVPTFDFALLASNQISSSAEKLFHSDSSLSFVACSGTGQHESPVSRLPASFIRQKIKDDQKHLKYES